MQLLALVEDLQSTGVPAAEFQALEVLLAELQTFLGINNPAEADIGRLCLMAEAVLQRFGSGTPDPAGGSPREAFWK